MLRIVSQNDFFDLSVSHLSGRWGRWLHPGDLIILMMNDPIAASPSIMNPIAILLTLLLASSPSVFLLIRIYAASYWCE